MSNGLDALEAGLEKVTQLEVDCVAWRRDLRSVDPAKQHAPPLLAGGLFRILVVELSAVRTIPEQPLVSHEGIEVSVQWTPYGVAHWPSDKRPQLVVVWSHAYASRIEALAAQPLEKASALACRRAGRALAKRLSVAAPTRDVSIGPASAPPSAPGATAGNPPADAPTSGAGAFEATCVGLIRALLAAAPPDTTEASAAAIGPSVDSASRALVDCSCKGANGALRADLVDVLSRLQRMDQHASALDDCAVDAGRDLGLQLRLAQENAKLADVFARDAKLVASRLQVRKRKHGRAIDQCVKLGIEDPSPDAALLTLVKSGGAMTHPVLAPGFFAVRWTLLFVGVALVVVLSILLYMYARSFRLATIALVLQLGVLLLWGYSWPNAVPGERTAPDPNSPLIMRARDWLAGQWQGLSLSLDMSWAAALGALLLLATVGGLWAHEIVTACTDLSNAPVEPRNACLPSEGGVALARLFDEWTSSMHFASLVMLLAMLVAWSLGHWNFLRVTGDGKADRASVAPIWVSAVVVAVGSASFLSLYAVAPSIAQSIPGGEGMACSARLLLAWCIVTSYCEGLGDRLGWRPTLALVLVGLAAVLFAVGVLSKVPEEMSLWTSDNLTVPSPRWFLWALFGVVTASLAVLFSMRTAAERKQVSLLVPDQDEDGKLEYKDAAIGRFKSEATAILTPTGDRLHRRMQSLELHGDATNESFRLARHRLCDRACKHLPSNATTAWPTWIWSDPSATPVAASEVGPLAELTQLTDDALQKHTTKVAAARFRRGDGIGAEFLATFRALPMKVGMLAMLLAVPLALIVAAGIGTETAAWLNIKSPAIIFGACTGGEPAGLKPLKPDWVEKWCKGVRADEFKPTGGKQAIKALFPLVLLAALVVVVVSRKISFDGLQEQVARDVEKRLLSVLQSRPALARQAAKVYRRHYDSWLKEAFEPYLERILAHGRAGLAQTGPQAKLAVQELKALQKLLETLRMKRLRAGRVTARVALGELGAAMLGAAPKGSPNTPSRRAGWWNRFRERWGL